MENLVLGFVIYIYKIPLLRKIACLHGNLIIYNVQNMHGEAHNSIMSTAKTQFSVSYVTHIPKLSQNYKYNLCHNFDIKFFHHHIEFKFSYAHTYVVFEDILSFTISRCYDQLPNLYN